MPETTTNHPRTIADLRHDPQNARRHTPRNIGMIAHSLQQFGAARGIVIDEDGTVLAGNGVLEAAAQAGIENVRVIETDGTEIVAVQVRHLTDEQKRQYAIADNRTTDLSDWDTDVLQAFLDEGTDLGDWFFEDELAGILEEAADDILDANGLDSTTEDADGDDAERASLSDRFLIPPFSVLDARQGYWQSRKSAWISLGIKSELGRGEHALGESEGVNDRHGIGSDGNGPARTFGQDLMRGEHVVGGGKPLTWIAEHVNERGLNYYRKRNSARAIRDHEWQREHLGGVQAPEESYGTSVFDPVLCELAYRWFCPPTGTVFDPFAGGSVRGIVAAKLGRRYTGIDLSARQIAANIEQAQMIVPDALPTWHVGDSRDARSIVGDAAPFDFVFSCPPYADLEIYSDDPRDLSTMPYDEFLTAYRDIIATAVDLLADDRFACFVVGDVRDRRGLYRNFVSDTIDAFHRAGARLYNEAILVTAVGSLPIRVGRQFESARKLGKTHQNVLVFVKGDPKRATQACGEITIDDTLFAAEADGEGRDADAPAAD